MWWIAWDWEGCVGFEVFTAVVMKSTIFWDTTPCSPLSVNGRFGGTYRLHHQNRKNKLSKKPAWNVANSAFYFAPDNGGDMFLRNVGWHSTDYTALYPRRWYSGKEVFVIWIRIKVFFTAVNIRILSHVLWHRVVPEVVTKVSEEPTASVPNTEFITTSILTAEPVKPLSPWGWRRHHLPKR
jgi:hypothetical protein